MLRYLLMALGKRERPLWHGKRKVSGRRLEGHENGSPQLVELRAVAIAFQRFPHTPLNVVTDSAYVADITWRLDRTILKEINNAQLFSLLKTLCLTIQSRICPYYILHIRSHTNLPGFVTEGNARADMLASPAWMAPQPDTVAQAKASHDFSTKVFEPYSDNFSCQTQRLVILLAPVPTAKAMLHHCR